LLLCAPPKSVLKFLLACMLIMLFYNPTDLVGR
jgi:hypothetical protein